MLTNSADAYNTILTLTKRQQEVLGAIAMNEDGGHHPKTLKVPLEKGLIEATTEILPGRLPVHITRYHTPIHVHIAYCDWASAQVGKEDNL